MQTINILKQTWLALIGLLLPHTHTHTPSTAQVPLGCVWESFMSIPVTALSPMVIQRKENSFVGGEEKEEKRRVY